VGEEVVEPDLPVVDPHHHLWPVDGRGGMPYSIDQLHADTGSGHRIVQTVFVECSASYRTEGPAELASLGETEFVAGIATADPTGLISGIVANVDLRLAATGELDQLLDAHMNASGGLFRGVRHALARAEYPEVLTIARVAPVDLYLDPAFRAGVRRLGERGFTYESWHYHYQNREFLELAKAVPETTMVLDHFGTPLGVGPYADDREGIFNAWKADIEAIAKCPNVFAKIGGFAMPDNGFGWHTASRPPTSDEFIEAQERYYLHTIQAFGPHRCMFESNFPVDRMSVSYRVVWNAFKKMTSGFSAAERTAMFSGTAQQVYRLPAVSAAPIDRLNADSLKGTQGTPGTK
jgi:L-fuconolactonase